MQVLRPSIPLGNPTVLRIVRTRAKVAGGSKSQHRSERSLRLSILLSLVCLVVIPSTAACQQTQVAEAVFGPRVQTASIDGFPVGCDLSFHIARGPRPGQWTEAIGATVSVMELVNGSWAASLKIGYQAGTPVVVPPERAFLAADGVANADEIAGQLPPNADGYISVSFLPGAQTRAVFAQLEQRGSLEINFALASGQPQTWTLDLQQFPAERLAWRESLAGFEVLDSE